MKIGAVMFFTTDSMQPAPLARALEERGFESLWVPEHTHIPSVAQDAVSGGRRADPALLRHHGSVPGAEHRGHGDDEAQDRHRHRPGDRSAIRSSPPRWSPRSTSSPTAASCSASATAGTRTRSRTTAPPSSTRHKLARERIEAMKAIWTKDEPEYHGEFVNFDKMKQWPKPCQKPHPPIIVGGAFPYAARARHPLRRRLDSARRLAGEGRRRRRHRHSSARWRRTPAAIRPACRSASSACPTRSTGCASARRSASTASSSPCRRRRRTRSCRSSTAGPN